MDISRLVPKGLPVDMKLKFKGDDVFVKRSKGKNIKLEQDNSGDVRSIYNFALKTLLELELKSGRKHSDNQIKVMKSCVKQINENLKHEKYDKSINSKQISFENFSKSTENDNYITSTKEFLDRIGPVGYKENNKFNEALLDKTHLNFPHFIESVFEEILYVKDDVTKQDLIEKIWALEKNLKRESLSNRYFRTDMVSFIRYQIDLRNDYGSTLDAINNEFFDKDKDAWKEVAKSTNSVLRNIPKDIFPSIDRYLST